MVLSSNLWAFLGASTSAPCFQYQCHTAPVHPCCPPGVPSPECLSVDTHRPLSLLFSWWGLASTEFWHKGCRRSLGLGTHIQGQLFPEHVYSEYCCPLAPDSWWFPCSMGSVISFILSWQIRLWSSTSKTHRLPFRERRATPMGLQLHFLVHTSLSHAKEMELQNSYCVFSPSNI